MRTSFKEIYRLAIPAIVAGIAEPLIGLADTAIIGHIGVTEQGAIGNGSQLYVFLLWVFTQSKTAISAIVSRYYGKSNIKDLKSLIPLSIVSVFGLGLFVALLSGLFTKPILSSFYNMDGEILKQSIDYYQIRAIGFPLTLTSFAIFGIFRGLQNTSWAMAVSIAGALSNVALDFIFVFGIDSLVPAMGVKGAAWASVIAQALILVLTLIFLKKKTEFGILPTVWKHIEMRHFWNMLTHLIIRSLALNLAFILSNRFATSYGEEYIAAHSIAMQIWLFFAFFIDGISNAGNAIAGKLLGKGDYIALKLLAKDVCKISFIFSILIAVVLLLGYNIIPHIFTNDETVASALKSFFWLVLLCQPVNAIAFSYDGIFKGLGEAKLLRNVLLFATFIGFIPTMFILDHYSLSMHGVWIALIIWMGFRALPLIAMFNNKFHSHQ